MTYQFFLSGTLGLALATGVLAQTRPPASSPSNPGSSGTGRLPSTTTNPRPNNTDPNTTQQLQRPMYVSGRVVLDDGTPPPEPVPVQILCGSSPRSVGFTDSKGRFDVDLNNRQNAALYSDSSQMDPVTRGYPGGGAQTNTTQQRSPFGGGDFSGPNLAGCDLQSFLAGFRSDRVSLTARRSLDSPEVGTIVLHRMGNVEGTTISITSALAPSNARKAFEKGLADEKKSKWSEAEREMGKAVQIYPKYATAWFHLGFAQQHLDNVDAARQSYAQALAADVKYVSPYQQLAVLAARDKKWEEVASATDRLLRLNPVDFPDSWLLNAIGNYQLHHLDPAEKAARQGLLVDTAHRYPILEQMLGVILAEKQQYPEAAEHMRAYLRLAPEAGDADTVRTQLAQLEKNIQPDHARKDP